MHVRYRERSAAGTPLHRWKFSSYTAPDVSLWLLCPQEAFAASTNITMFIWKVRTLITNGPHLFFFYYKGVWKCFREPNWINWKLQKVCSQHSWFSFSYTHKTPLKAKSSETTQWRLNTKIFHLRNCSTSAPTDSHSLFVLLRSSISFVQIQK